MTRPWRRQIYGVRQPRWWPKRLGGWLGPRNPHDNQSVVIFVGPDRYEFVPAVSGWCRGHVYHGRLRPDATHLTDCLARLDLPTDAARTLAIISGFEGGFDSIQTYDRGKFSWGFIQFTATGGLPRLLQNLKTFVPGVFDECFGAVGIDVELGKLTIQVNGRLVRGRGAHNRLHDDPSLWTSFLRASRLPQAQDIQVRTAYENYYAYPLTGVVTLGTRNVTLGGLFAESEYGKALVCDRAVNRGVGHTISLFRRATERSGARALEDAPAVLECVRAMEASDAWRLDALEQKLLEPSGPSRPS